MVRHTHTHTYTYVEAYVFSIHLISQTKESGECSPLMLGFCSFPTKQEIIERAAEYTKGIGYDKKNIEAVLKDELGEWLTEEECAKNFDAQEDAGGQGQVYIMSDDQRMMYCLTRVKMWQ